MATLHRDVWRPGDPPPHGHLCAEPGPGRADRPGRQGVRGPGEAAGGGALSP